MGEATGAPFPYRVDAAELARRVRARRHELGLSLRGAAAKAGVSAPTLSRVERGGYLPERENLFRLLRWTGLELERQPPAGEQTEAPRDVHPPEAPTMEAVELHLRADRNLKEEDAEALVEMFRLAYERLRVRGEPE